MGCCHCLLGLHTGKELQLWGVILLSRSGEQHCSWLCVRHDIYQNRLKNVVLVMALKDEATADQHNTCAGSQDLVHRCFCCCSQSRQSTIACKLLCLAAHAPLDAQDADC